MNRFLKIFETALNNSNPAITKQDVNEVMLRLRSEAMAPGSLTADDSTLVARGNENDPHTERTVFNGSSITDDDVLTVMDRCRARGKDLSVNPEVVDSIQGALEFELNKLTKRDKGVAVDVVTQSLLSNERFYIDLDNLMVGEIQTEDTYEDNAGSSVTKPENGYYRLKKSGATTDDTHIEEESTTGAVAKAFQPQTDGQKLVIAKMLADALEKACEFGRDDLNTTEDNLEELGRRVSPRERTRLRNYCRRHEPLGRDVLGQSGLKPDSLDEEDLPKDENGALATPHTNGRIAIGKIVS